MAGTGKIPEQDERSATKMRDSKLITNLELEKLNRGQRGITGLETAIILIAFVVVASVFAFTILSSGVFAAERSKQSISAGLQDTRSTLLPKGGTRAFRGFDSANEPAIFKFSFTVANSVGGEPVDLNPPYTADDLGTDPDQVPSADYVTVISYTDEFQYLSDVPWTVKFIGANNGDNVLEVGESAEITVWLMDLDTTVAVGATSSIAVMNGTGDGFGGAGGITVAADVLGTNTGFSVEMKPARGAIIQVDRRTPPALGRVMQLQ